MKNNEGSPAPPSGNNRNHICNIFFWNKNTQIVSADGGERGTKRRITSMRIRYAHFGSITSLASRLAARVSPGTLSAHVLGRPPMELDLIAEYGKASGDRRMANGRNKQLYYQ